MRLLLAAVVLAAAGFFAWSRLKEAPAPAKLVEETRAAAAQPFENMSRDVPAAQRAASAQEAAQARTDEALKSLEASEPR